MKYINAYKVFESTGISDEEVAELIEECKDIIETFNEAEDKFKIANYKNGFVSPGTSEGFNSIQTHESDQFAILFYLGLENDISTRNYSDLGDIVTTERIDELIELMSKSKYLVQRLSRYCEKIYYKLNGKSIKFILLFANPDKKGSKNAKIERIKNKIRNNLEYYGNNKTITLVQTSGDNRFIEKYKPLYDLIKNNPNLIGWDESDRNYLQLKYISRFSVTSEYIIINVSGFKYKTYRMDKFKSIVLSNEEKEEAMKCISMGIVNMISQDDRNSVETFIVDNKIKIKVK